MYNEARIREKKFQWNLLLVVILVLESKGLYLHLKKILMNYSKTGSLLNVSWIVMTENKQTM